MVQWDSVSGTLTCRSSAAVYPGAVRSGWVEPASVAQAGNPSLTKADT